MSVEEKTPSGSSEPTRPDSAIERFRAAAGAGASDDLNHEEVLWEGSYSGKAMFGSWLLALLVTIGGAIAALMLLESALAWTVILAAVVVIWGGLGFSLLYRKWNAWYQLTSQRLVHKHGIVRRVTDRIEAIDIDDVTYSQGIVQRLLGVGNIRITSSDRTHPELNLIGIDRVDAVADLIDDVRRRERRQRGLHIESI